MEGFCGGREQLCELMDQELQVPAVEGEASSTGVGNVKATGSRGL